MKKIVLFIMVILLSFCCVGCGIVNNALTNVIEDSNVVCKGQKFETPELALAGREKEARDNYDIALDYCPPFELVYSFEYEENTIIFYSYSLGYDEAVCSGYYAIRILSHNDDGTYTFTGGFADFYMKEPYEDEWMGMDYYYFTNIDTDDGMKSISFLYLEKDNEKDVYVDGKKCEKVLVNMEGQEFYMCYAVSNRDTFLSNLFTPISFRHSVEVK